MNAEQTSIPTTIELLRTMRKEGIDQEIPGTGRIIRLRSLDAPELLRSGKMPDILTPLVIRSVYTEVTDEELRSFLGQQRVDVQDALSLLETLDFVAAKCIMDETSLDDLTLAEKRWIFRLVMGPAELLVTFRYDPSVDVADVAESEELQPVAE